MVASRARVVDVASLAEDERDPSGLRAARLSQIDMQRRAGIESGAGTSAQSRATERRRTADRTVSTDELGAVAGERAGVLGGVIEGDPVAKVRAVSIAGENRTAGRRGWWSRTGALRAAADPATTPHTRTRSSACSRDESFVMVRMASLTGSSGATHTVSSCWMSATACW